MALANPCRGLRDSVSPGRGVGLPLPRLRDLYPALLSHCQLLPLSPLPPHQLPSLRLLRAFSRLSGLLRAQGVRGQTAPPWGHASEAVTGVTS